MPPIILTDAPLPDLPVILYVENNFILQRAVRDTLALAGWLVDTCAYGIMARELLHTERRYDLLLLDTELPHVTGLELARLARQLPHRKHTPILIFSLRDCAQEARQAGANEYLKKPSFLLDLMTTVKRLLNAHPRN